MHTHATTRRQALTGSRHYIIQHQHISTVIKRPTIYTCTLYGYLEYTHTCAQVINENLNESYDFVQRAEPQTLRCLALRTTTKTVHTT